MKTILLTIGVLIIHLSTMAQEPNKKKLHLNLNVMAQGVTKNYAEGSPLYFKDSNKNIDVHFKLGKFLFKEKIVIGLGFNFRTVNDTKYIGNEDFNPETDYIGTLETQLGFFVRYKAYDKLFVEGYAGLFGWILSGGIFPKANYGPIIKHKLGIGYSFNIWHFLAIEPNISLMNPRELFRGKGNLADDVGIVSYGIGIAFKL